MKLLRRLFARNRILAARRRFAGSAEAIAPLVNSRQVVLGEKDIVAPRTR